MRAGTTYSLCLYCMCFVRFTTHRVKDYGGENVRVFRSLAKVPCFILRQSGGRTTDDGDRMEHTTDFRRLSSILRRLACNLLIQFVFEVGAGAVASAGPPC